MHLIPGLIAGVHIIISWLLVKLLHTHCALCDPNSSSAIPRFSATIIHTHTHTHFMSYSAVWCRCCTVWWLIQQLQSSQPPAAPGQDRAPNDYILACSDVCKVRPAKLFFPLSLHPAQQRVVCDMSKHVVFCGFCEFAIPSNEICKSLPVFLLANMGCELRWTRFPRWKFWCCFLYFFWVKKATIVWVILIFIITWHYIILKNLS